MQHECYLSPVFLIPAAALAVAIATAVPFGTFGFRPRLLHEAFAAALH